MLKAAVFCLSALCLSSSCAEVKKVHQNDPRPNAIPTLTIVNDTTATALRITSLDIDIAIAANVGTTTFDITFYNPNNRVLEGEFEFPLADGQHITRYALDMNGNLREGVVVEKAKARVAFEATIRQNIDPGLVEKTKGNNYRTRVYPLPAKGYRRIVIAVEETLEQQALDLQYRLPLYAPEAIDTFDLRARVIKSTEKPVVDEKGITMDFKKEDKSFTAEHHANDFLANHTVAFTVPGSGGNTDVVLTENFGGETYFYANMRVEPKFKEKKKPSSIGILWDVSSSAEKRNLDKEIELLRSYLSSTGNTRISLIPFNIYLQEKEDFTNAGDLISRIKSLVYDGGTQYGAIDLSKYAFDEVLLFSDGLSTFGKDAITIGNAPITTITTSSSADYSHLKYIARESNGDFIDLGKAENDRALEQLKGQSLQLVGFDYNPSEIDEIVAQTTPVINTGLSFAGKLKTASATVTVKLGYGNEVLSTRTLTITNPGKSDYEQVKRIWATMKINELDMEFEKNKGAITKLGKEFSIVTQNTSLIVLDRVEDYVEHGITPPKELQKEYYSLLKIKEEQALDEKKTAMDNALSEMEEMKTWWLKNHKVAAKQSVTYDPLADSLRFTIPDTVASVNGITSFYSNATAVTDSTRGPADAEPPAAEEMKLEASDNDVAYLRVNPGVGATDAFAATATSNEWGAIEPSSMSQPVESTIALSEWKPDVVYLKTLEKADAKERFKKYLELKKEYSNQPSFFVDVARFFIEKKDLKKGIQVLSNVAEMELEDATLQRILANQLLEAGEKELAVETFRQILKMREEDPQSYRDLALACNETGRYNEAVELLYKVITGVWDGRFGDIRTIAINEMNAIISARGNAVNTSGIDKRLIYAMPVDVRIVIAWNTDNSDMDLWVTDPRMEKCDYSHNQTMIGGRISQDVTQGFGPEEFSLKKAIKGNYMIEVNLYGDTRQTMGGPIAIKADLFTDFGKPTQKKKTINFRVTTAKEVVNIGSLNFGS
jgi:tetratricopeptide (TPR) repeat protein